jgi:RNA polymerase sigma-70 factor (ECF subfamily)
MSTLQETGIFGLAGYFPALLPRVAGYREIYEQNRHRIYALAFWMTDNELVAEELMIDSFCRAFAYRDRPTPEEIDCALVDELRACTLVGVLTLNCAPCDKVFSVRHSKLRVDLELAVVQLPGTERLIFLMHDVEGYDHARIAKTLGVTEAESRSGLHQARLRMRELLAR